MRRKWFIDGVFAIAFILAILFLVITIRGWREKEFTDGDYNKAKTNVSDKDSNSNNNRDQIDDVVTMMHEMSNTLIIAEDDKIWGTRTMNKENIEKALESVRSNSESSNAKKLIKILEGWQQGNFDNIVKDHNTVWRMLGGSVGKAKDANKEAVAIAKDSMQ